MSIDFYYNSSSEELDGEEIFDQENLVTQFPDELLKRMECVEKFIFKSSQEIEVDQSEIVVVFDFKKIAATPNVSKQKGMIRIEIPFLFLLNCADLNENSSIFKWFKEKSDFRKLTKVDCMNLSAFRVFIQNSEKAEKAKKFVVYHELAHIALGHLNSPKCSHEESREMEKAADLVAAYFAGKEGGIYLFNIMAEFDQRESSTHPSYRDRIAYLQSLR